MNKGEFVSHIAEQHKCTKTEAEKVIDMFTSSVIDAMGQGSEISLVGFGNFTINHVVEKTMVNPKTRATVQVPAHNQPRFKVGSKLKEAVNKK